MKLQLFPSFRTFLTAESHLNQAVDLPRRLDRWRIYLNFGYRTECVREDGQAQILSRMPVEGELLWLIFFSIFLIESVGAGDWAGAFKIAAIAAGVWAFVATVGLAQHKYYIRPENTV